MNAKEYPFRDQVMLSQNIKLVVWRDAKMLESQTEICQREPSSDIPMNVSDGSWFVRARFRYTPEAIQYLRDIKLLEVI